MRTSAVQELVQDYGWIHTGLGLIGNLTFFAGSILFLPVFEPVRVWGTWLFIVGSALMLVGTAGNLLIKVYEARDA